MGHPVLGRHTLDHGARNGNGTAPGDGRNNVGPQISLLVPPGGIQTDIAPSPLGAEGPLQKVHLTADAGQLPAAH